MVSEKKHVFVDITTSFNNLIYIPRKQEIRKYPYRTENEKEI